jgi:hypothetical protein
MQKLINTRNYIVGVCNTKSRVITNQRAGPIIVTIIMAAADFGHEHGHRNFLQVL